jgi:4-hydroxy-3-polyprenylbenzoate decarboxylase
MNMPVEGVFHNLVITQIKKEYAGQGQKVMNAMWGAGQMMFNKILVLTAAPNFPERGTLETSFKISEYEKLARDVFKNLNPATDVYFSQGPMDVLDHSCSKLGFGGKMCIDGTFKFDEERDENFRSQISDFRYDLDQIISNKFSEIKSVNISLLKIKIPVLIISVEKSKINHIRELHQSVCDLEETEGIKMILYVEHTVDANDLNTALWRFCNNLDPKRDNILFQRPSLLEPGKAFACLGLDGTRKTKQHDNFQRDWPNIIVADEKTIKSVDEKWQHLGLGKFIPSPSLKFKDQMYGEEAVVG